MARPRHCKRDINDLLTELCVFMEVEQRKDKTLERLCLCDYECSYCTKEYRDELKILFPVGNG